MAIEPAALLLVPMLEVELRRGALREERINQPLVKVQAASSAAARRQNARPRGREAIGGKIAMCEQLDVLAPSRITIFHVPRRMEENILDALAGSVLIDCAF